MAALLAVLTACGGSDDSQTSTSDTTTSNGRARALATATPAQAQWGALIPLTLVPSAATNLPNGKVLMWSATGRFDFGLDPGNTFSTLFDPATGTSVDRLVTETDHAMFCPGTTNLPDGRILVNGGSSSDATSLYDPVSGLWTAVQTMNIRRGYQANTLLPDGSVLTLGGSWNGGLGGKNAEVWTAAGGWRLLSGVPVTSMLGADPAGIYRSDNHMWLIPTANGKVLQAGPSAAMNWIDTRGSGTTAAAGPRGDDTYAINGSTVMYDIGKILKTGGAPAYQDVAATDRAYVISVSGGTASVRRLASMNYQRGFHNSVVLPNGQVLILGGQTLPVPFLDGNSVLVPELWDPVTETFTLMPPMQVPRNYHSTALLLPDARVASIGGGLCGDGCAGNHPDLQILTPHYLLNPDGSAAVRPAITTGATQAAYGSSLAIGTDSPVTAFALVRVSSNTHTVNNDQRRIPLQFTTTGTNQYALAIPSNPGVALPGYYMLFALNANGVPSVAKTIRISSDTTPQLQSPGDQQSVIATATTVTLVASGPGTISFAATGLPPGLTVNSTSGAISGTPSATGNYLVTVSASNTAGTVSTELRWSVQSSVAASTRYVKLEAISEASGLPLISIAEFNLLDTTGALIPRTGWVASADSQETTALNAPASSAIDGSTATFWQSQQQGTSSPLPHSLIVDRGVGPLLGGFKMLPSQDSTNGRIAAWRFYVSADGVQWRVVSQGTFANDVTEKTVFPIDTSGTNQNPVLTTPPNQSVNVGTAATLTLSASDPNGDTLSYAVSNLPPGLTVNASTGVISGTPTTAGIYNAGVVVSDGRGGTASATIAWTVLAAGATPPPRYVKLEAVTEVNGQAWTTMAEFNLLDTSGAVMSRTGWVASSDSQQSAGYGPAKTIDGDPNTFWHTQYSPSSPPPPHSLVIDRGVGGPAIGGFKMLPRQDGGVNGRIGSWRFYVSDDGTVWRQIGSGTFANDATEKTVLTVDTSGPNQAPVLTTPPNPTSTAGTATTLALSATDPNGDTLTYAVTNLPPGLTVNASTGVISGTPTTAGTYNSVVVVVSDARGGSATATIVWTVLVAPNQNPVLTTPPNPTSTVGVATTLALSATDPNGDPLSYAVTGLPPGLTVNASTGVISGTPTTAGTYSAVVVVVNDGRGGSATATIVWTIQAAGTVTPPRYVKLEALTEVNGNAWTSVAEFNLLDANNAVMARTGWVASADSQQTGNEAAKAIDGATTSLWHTQWYPTSPTPPHTLIIDRGTGTLASIGGFKMLPRQDGGVNGRIASWRFHVSADGVTWRLIASGTFANDATEKTVLAVDPLSTNQNPVLTTPANPTSTVGTAATLALSATDPNGDALSYAVTNLPPGLTVNASTGVISGTPTTAGTYSAVIVVSDGRGGSATATVVWTVQAAANRNPVLTTPANPTSTVGTAATLALSATDPNGDTLSYAVTNLPPGLTVNTSSGVISGTPTAVGTYNAVIVVSDGRGGSATATIVWTVQAATPTNQNPVLVTPANPTSTVGTAATLALSATDPNGDTLSYAVTNLPPGLTVNASTGVISGTPTTAGTYSAVIVVSDGRGGSATATIVWTVQAAANQNPVLVTPANPTSTVGTAASLALSATDPNGDTLSYAVTGLPPGLTVNASTGVISGTPTTAGTYSAVVVVVSDGRGGSATATIVWTVQAATPTNQNPVLVTPANPTSTVGTAATLALSATDPNGDTLSYAVTNLPTGLTVNASTGVISGTPTTAGTYSAVIVVSDGRGGSATATIVWTVQAAANQNPVLTTPANPTSTVGTATTLTLSATDPNGDTLSYAVTGLPPGLTVNASTGVISGTPTTAGTYSAVVVVVNDGRGGSATATIVWTVRAAVTVPSSRYVKLEALAEVNGQPWTSLAEFNLLDANNAVMARTGWVATADSQQTGNEAANAIDGVTTSLWHTQWYPTSPIPPHSLVIDRGTGTLATIGGFKMLPRQDGGVNGRIASWRFHVSDDGVTWRLIASGTFANDATEKTVLTVDPLTTNQNPVLTTPANPTSTVGTAATLTLSATDPNGDALTYAVTNLPPGLTVNASTGVISGTPTTAGTYNAVVVVSDGRGGSATATVVWTVQVPTITIQPVAAAPLASGSTASYTANTDAGAGATYRWDFGDGSAAVTAATVTHAYAAPGLYTVTLTATSASGLTKVLTFTQAIYAAPSSTARATQSANIVPFTASGAARVWVVNPDGDSVSLFDGTSFAKLGEVAVGTAPRSAALAPDGKLWVANKGSTTISIVDPATLAVTSTIALPRASMPFGIAFAPNNGAAYVTLEATGKLLKLDPTSGTVLATLDVGTNPRHLSVTPASDRVLVSRFISPPLPGESTASVQAQLAGVNKGGEVVVVNTTSFSVERTVVLQLSTKVDSSSQGRGLPNYLAAAVISPDGTSAWVPSKQDNVQRGTLRDGLNLDFQDTVRAITSRIDLATFTEDYPARVDHDNSSLASAAVFHPTGAYLFVALQTSRQVAVIDPARKVEVLRFDAGRAPDGIAVSADGLKLFVNNLMDRSLQVFDLTRLVNFGEPNVPSLAVKPTQAAEKLSAQALLGKQLFYDARDTRLARDSYMSCASCHNDGGHDGRVWDFTGLGEGLRNTISLRGRGGMGQGFLHWSANFDEVQDFEGQIRNFAGGTGLMTDALFNTGTRSQPLGLTKAGLSADLDALAAYLTSLNTFVPSPLRQADGSLSAAAVAGKAVFATTCASCHGGTGFTDSAAANLHNVGTLKASSGTRLGAALTGIDTPTLRDVWATAPYLHDGSAPTVSAAITAHTSITLSTTDLANVAAYVQQIGSEEPALGAPRYVRLQALSEVNGNAWTSMADFNLLDATGAVMSRTGWVASADSQDSGNPASNAIDASTATMWHTSWYPTNVPPPHTFTVDLGTPRSITGFKYLPRTDGGVNGRIANWQFFTSVDGVTWTQAASGTFANTAAEKTVLISP